jgi:L-alanine-DL-glutamate epimerase-like enolase superfamily enzyme
MQITRCKVTPVELQLRNPVYMAGKPPIHAVMGIFVRVETRQGQVAWGCTIVNEQLTGDDPELVLETCQRCAERLPYLNPLNLEYSLSELVPLSGDLNSVMCAFDLALHDLLALAADMPLYRLMGGFRNRMQTSVTIPLCGEAETVELAELRASQGFRMLKIKGGIDPQEDVRRVKSVKRAFPDHILRLDADGGYNVQEAIDVARTLENVIEMFEQPTPAENLDNLYRVTKISPVPVLAAQSATNPESVLKLAAGRCADGISIKLVNCGGFRCARQVDSIARAAKMSTMIGCLIEPAMLVSAGLSLALSSANVRYGDLDGYLDLENDPSMPGFELRDGWLVASDVTGIGYNVNLD